MNYEKHYELLIFSRKDRLLKEGEYYEKHHIKPRCLGGDDSKDNLVILTAREHYVAHWLLAKIHSDNWKIKMAFFQMSKMNNKNERVITSSQFERSKKYMSDAMKLRHQDSSYSNPGRGDKSRAKAKERMSGVGNPMRGKPEKNPTARPHRVIFEDGTEKVYAYGKLGYEDIGMSRSSWIAAVAKGIPVPSYKVKKIIKE